MGSGVRTEGDGQFVPDRRLEAHFATLRSRRPAHWRLYAGVTGSAMAMATALSAAIIGSDPHDATAPAEARIQPGTQQLATLRTMPIVGVIRSAMAQQQSPQQPSISPNGVVPIFGTIPVIQPGEWITIWGTNLAGSTASWTGNFPLTLGGVSVTIDGKPAYLSYVSPTQINAQAPDDTATGTVPVVVTTSAGNAASTVTLSQFAPSFSLIDAQNHVAGIILRKDNRGAYGNGTYDILGPTGSALGYRTVAASPGDVVELYAVGLGPTNPPVPAGQVFSGSAPLAATTQFTLYINNFPIVPTYVGITSAGLYQINLIVPASLGEGDVPILMNVAGAQSQPHALFSLATSGGGYPYSGGTVVGTPGAPGFYSGPGAPGFSSGGGGGGGGTGGGSGYARHKKTYHPKLRFDQKPAE